jgi:hypothetical protein
MYGFLAGHTRALQIFKLRSVTSTKMTGKGAFGSLHFDVFVLIQPCSIGKAPYNMNTLYGFLNLTSGTAGEMENYTCDMSTAYCSSKPETFMIAKVLYAWSR